jgi:glycosyltransferase involved in cell wall biosynthesis
MRILYYIPQSQTKGGIQSFADSQYESLKSRYDIERKNWCDNLSLIQKIVLRCLPKRIATKIYLMIERTSNIKKGTIISEESWDVVHFWHIQAAIANTTSVPSLITCHGLEILIANVASYKKLLYKEAFAKASFVIANSKFTKNYLVEHYGVKKNKIIVINPGVDIEKFKKNHKKKNEKYVVGTLTRLVNRKNIPKIISALVLLKADYNVDFVYYLAGDGPERESIIKKLEASGVGYRYFGEISEENKVNKFYPALDVFVLPPTETPRDVEGFGIVYIEANASGVPVIAANTGGISDAVMPGVSGFFADPFSEKDIAKKIYMVLSTNGQLRTKSKEWATNFNEEDVANKLSEIYGQIGIII